jgi:CRISPR-associated protein Cmr3
MLLAYLEPLDTLFFRDNRPFEAGVDSFAETILPSPLTIYGAIGSYILKQNGTDIKKFLNHKIEDKTLGKYDEELKDANLKIKGIFLKKGNNIYLPVPANYFRVNGHDYKLAYPSGEKDKKDFLWDIKKDLKPIRLPEGKCKEVSGYISIREKKKILINEAIILNEPTKKADLYIDEWRFGHKMNRQISTVSEGFLYATRHLRFKEVLDSKVYVKTQFLILIDGLDSSAGKEDVLFLGGEGKKVKVKFEKFDKDKWFDNQFKQELFKKIQEKKKFFLYLLTPAIFENGFYGNFNNFKLISAAVKKPIYISGWKRTDITQGNPREIKKAVPAGSVYFFEIQNDIVIENLYNTYQLNESISEKYPSAGFGITLIGIW